MEYNKNRRNELNMKGNDKMIKSMIIIGSLIASLMSSAPTTPINEDDKYYFQKLEVVEVKGDEYWAVDENGCTVYFVKEVVEGQINVGDEVTAVWDIENTEDGLIMVSGR
jgi:hypothetical protein